MFSEIQCISSAAGLPTNGSVQVMIDGAHLSGHMFHYLEDPQYYSIHPQYIIPRYVHSSLHAGAKCNFFFPVFE